MHEILLSAKDQTMTSIFHIYFHRDTVTYIFYTLSVIEVYLKHGFCKNDVLGETVGMIS